MFLTSVVFRVYYDLSLRGDEKRFQAQIYAYGLLTYRQWLDRFLNQKRDEIAAYRVFGDRNT